MLNCAPVIEAMAVTDFPGGRLKAWPTGGTEEGDSTKIYSQKCNAKLQNSSKPENQTLQLKSSVLPVKMPRAFPARQKYAAAAWNGVGCGQPRFFCPSGASHP